MRISQELQIGKAGEYLVCCDLALKGFIAFPSDQGLPYDVLLDNGKRLFKIQVKTTTGPRQIPQRAKTSFAYIFNIKKHGKNNTKRYTQDEIDVFALVALDIMKVGYIIADDMPETMNIRCDNLRGEYYDEKGIQDYERVMKLKQKFSGNGRVKRGMVERISEASGLSVATINSICHKGYKPFKTNARYFSDFLREKEWFLNL